MKNKLIEHILKYILLLAFFAAAAIIMGMVARNNNMKIYNEAKRYYDAGQFQEASELYEELGDFEDSEKMAALSKDWHYLDLAAENIRVEKYEEAVINLYKISDTDERVINKKNELVYQVAIEYFNTGLFNNAKPLFESIEKYEDSSVYLARIEVRTIDDKKKELYSSAMGDYDRGDYQVALSKFRDLVGYKEADAYTEKCEEMIKRTDRNKTIAGGIINSVAITSDGKLLYTNKYNSKFEKTADWENLVSVDTYGEIIIAVDIDKNIYTAGTYDNGTELSFARKTDCVDVAAGEQFAIALFSDGKVEARGHNDDEQCNVDDWNNYEVVDVDAGWRFSVGLTSDGELLFAGVCQSQKKQYSAEKDLWKDVVSISSSGGGESAVGEGRHGKGHTVGLKKDGTVVAVGDNSYGQCNVEEWSDVVRVATGDWYTIGIKNDGTVLITGNNRSRMQYIDSGMFEHVYEDVAAGYGQTLLITKDGRVDAYGFNDYKKRDIADSWSDIKIMQ